MIRRPDVNTATAASGAEQRIAELQRELADVRHAMRQQHGEARTDTLTGLQNRRALDEQLPRFLRRARAAAAPLSVLFFDVRNLKQINDRWGHLAGDQCLRLVADELRQSLRPQYWVARRGGDEFVAILAGCELAAAQQLAETIAARIEHRAVNWSKTLVPSAPGQEDTDDRPRFGVVVAAVQAESGESVDDVLHRLDAELILKKRG